MRLIVADASVVIKWLLPARNEERDGEQALSLLQAVRADEVGLVTGFSMTVFAEKLRKISRLKVSRDLLAPAA